MNDFKKLLSTFPEIIYVPLLLILLLTGSAFLMIYIHEMTNEAVVYPLDRANNKAISLLKEQGYKEIIKNKAYFQTFPIGSGCYSKDIEVDISARNVNNKYTEVALCCSDKEGCFPFSVKEF